MLARFVDYLGTLGLISASCSLAALLLIVVALSLKRFRTTGLIAAALVAIVALNLASRTSEQVNTYEREVVNPFAAMAPLPEEQKKEPEYAYRKAGKQEREGGQETGENQAAIEQQEDLKPNEPKGRVLSDEEYDIAQTMDSWNFSAARLACYLSIFILFIRLGFVAYKSLTRGAPLGDWHPTGTVSHATAGSPKAVRQLLQRLVHHGERFVSLGGAVPRLTLNEPAVEMGELRWRTVAHSRLVLPAELDAQPLLLDEAWHGYTCIVATGAAVGETVARLQALLENRLNHGQRADCTLNIVCLEGQAPSAALEALLREHGERLNCRLLLVSTESKSAALDASAHAPALAVAPAAASTRAASNAPRTAKAAVRSAPAPVAPDTATHTPRKAAPAGKQVTTQSPVPDPIAESPTPPAVTSAPVTSPAPAPVSEPKPAVQAPSAPKSEPAVKAEPAPKLESAPKATPKPVAAPKPAAKPAAAAPAPAPAPDASEKISATCPKCSKKLVVKRELLGKKVRCPGCQTVFPASE